MVSLKHASVHLKYLTIFGFLSLGWIKMWVFLLNNREWATVDFMLASHIILGIGMAIGLTSRKF